MPIVAETERLRLRSWTDADRDPYRRHCNRPRVMKYLGGVQEADELDADVAWFVECERLYGHTLWVVDRKGDGAFLGFAGLDKLLVENGEVPSTLHGEVEVGWRLRDDAWGRGYATEVAHVSLEIGFRIRRFAQIFTRIHRENSASLRIATKLGFERSRKWEASDSLHVFRIDRKTWFASSDRGY
ncbi:GNAT family N-acetyltransferase [Sphingomonas sp. LY160]|uniref:GNAT family N-acetyltransferase n=1 Tax=Sphingomonas sp. LY160 TaxID=3095342 RepID=UPI002ADEB9E5|nr:GNAT family N-acetyltransferase [Sphingomonas sp. LY160]MEA1071727.1 GNAT family N-acetyltransferase [Sphingomonas sp. LY160]